MRINIFNFLFLLIILETLKLINCGKKAKEKQKKKNQSIGQSSNISKNNELIEQKINQELQNIKNILDRWNGYNILNDNYIEKPELTEEYENMVNVAISYFEHPIGKNIIDNLIKKIKEALQDRKLRYIRMIGAGSMFGHLNHYYYDDSVIAKNERFLIEKLDNNYKQKYLKCSQITAIFQFILELLIIKHFNELQIPKEGIKGKEIASNKSSEINYKIIATFEDMHLNEKYEKEYLKNKYNIYGIKPNDKYENLIKIPEIVSKMENDETTLILMIQCPPEMTLKIIDSYNNKKILENIILIESALSYDREELINYRQKFLPSIKAFEVNPFTNLFYFPNQTNIYFKKWTKGEDDEEN